MHVAIICSTMLIQWNAHSRRWSRVNQCFDVKASSEGRALPQLLNDSLDNALRIGVRCFDPHLGLCIMTPPLVPERAEIERGLVRCQRSNSGTGKPLQDQLEGSIEPDGLRLAIERVTNMWIDEGAPADGDHLGFFGLEEAQDQLTFRLGELRVSPFAEELRDRHAANLLDLAVRIDKRKVQPLSEETADPRLPRRHEANEDD